MANNRYNPSDKIRQTISEAYSYIDDMVEARNKSYRQFNDRSLKDYIDDSEKRLNSYVLSREAQEKEDWQANIALPTIRDKQKRMIAGFSLQVPDMITKAYGDNNMLDVDRAYVAKNLIQGSYLQEENPIIENFWEAWEASTKGTIIKYEGYLKTRYKQKFIKSYDLITGEVEESEKEVDVDDQCISMLVPLTEFYIYNFFVHDVQEQPRIAWIRYYDRGQLEHEFGQYQNFKYALPRTEMKRDTNSSFFYELSWSKRTDDSNYEVVRLYDKSNDSYKILVNGVLLLDAPILWRVNGKKVYPFAKSIWEPFGSKHFFYGKSFPDVMMPLYDIQNNLFNSLLDKEYRSMVAPMLVGSVNMDAFDLEDEIVTGTTRIRVEDVNQVKPMQIKGLENADVAMIELVAEGINNAAPALSDMVSGKDPTAREVVLAEEKMKELKTMHHEFLIDLWRQKYMLRLANIQLNYPQPRKIVDNDGKVKVINRVYMIDNAILDPVTGEMGVLAIQFQKISDPKEKRNKEMDLAAEEQFFKSKGLNYKKILITPTYLDNYRFQIEVMPESLYKASLAKMQTSAAEKIQLIANYFPEIFIVNQEEYFRQLSESYDDKPDKYITEYSKFKQAQSESAQGGQLTQGVQEQIGQVKPIQTNA